MSLEAELRAVLAPTVGGRVTPDVAPDDPVYPLTIYQAVGGTTFDYSEGAVSDKRRPRVQVWVWAKSRLEASAIANAQRVAMVEGPMRALALGEPVSDHNDVLKIYGNRTDYEVWYTP